jgi:hypothetical protein
MNIDKKSFAVGVLSLTAVVLFVGNLLLPETATGAVAVKERDYTAVTGRTARGGEALYLTDNRTGLLGVFAFDPGKRAITAVAVRPVSDAFSGRNVGGGGGREERGGGRNNR